MRYFAVHDDKVAFTKTLTKNRKPEDSETCTNYYEMMWLFVENFSFVLSFVILQ